MDKTVCSAYECQTGFFAWSHESADVQKIPAERMGRLRGSNPAKPMRIKLSSVPLCKAGDWGLQTPEKCFCFGFLRLRRKKTKTKRGLGLRPNGK
jgi:hypothetical protein